VLGKTEDAPVKEQIDQALDGFAANVETHLNKIRRVRHEMEKAGDQDLVAVANLVQFMELFILDFTFICMDHSDGRHKWRQGLYGRIISLMIVECFEDFGELLAGKLRTTINSLDYAPSVLTNLGTLHGDLHQLRTRHESTLREIRNNVFGHRDHNAAHQIEMMESLDRTRLVRVQRDLMKWLLQLQDFLYTLVKPLPGFVKSRRSQRT